MAREIEPIVKELKKNGKTIYSISRLNSFNDCKLAYKYTYIDYKKGIDNVYNLLGTLCHDNKEALLKGKITKDDFLKIFDDEIFELDIKGIEFPSENIKSGYIQNIRKYIMEQEDNNKKCIIEKFVIMEVDEDNYIQGFIDYIDGVDGKLRILDFKTSTAYSGEEKVKSGRQLILYKLALEKITGKEVVFVGWDLLKYCNICKMQKNGKVKKYLIERRKVANEMADRYTKDLKEMGKEQYEIDLILFDNKDIPDELKDVYWKEDGIVELKVDEEMIQETMDYLNNSINNIKNEKDFNAKVITEKNSFYCSFLCGHRLICPHLKEYRNNLHFD